MSAILGAALAIVLLALYVFGVVMIWRDPASEPNEAIETVLSGVGGLLSSLIVAVLSLTPAQGNPATAVIGLLGDTQSVQQASDPATSVVVAYFVCWLFCGLALWLRWGLLPRGTANSALKSAAKAWFAIMLVAGFAYFGLEPPQ